MHDLSIHDVAGTPNQTADRGYGCTVGRGSIYGAAFAALTERSA